MLLYFGSEGKFWVCSHRTLQIASDFLSYSLPKISLVVFLRSKGCLAALGNKISSKDSETDLKEKVLFFSRFAAYFRTAEEIIQIDSQVPHTNEHLRASMFLDDKMEANQHTN